jgi:methionyl-tRNA formyltransferase
MNKNHIKNIAIIGRTNTLYQTTKILKENNFKIKIIITSTPADYDKITANDFKKLAKKMGADYIFTKNINENKIQDKIKKANADLGISINNTLLISKEVLSKFKFGILNLHAGDLPKYRGNATANWAILNGEKKIVLTIHKMDEGLDSGDIVIQNNFRINDQTTITDFYEYLENIGPNLFLKAIKFLESKKKLKKQTKNQSLVLRTFPRQEKDGLIDWSKSAIDIARLIRASGSPFNGAYTYYNLEKLYILKAKPEIPKFKFLSEVGQVTERRKTGEICIACKDGFLIISKIKYKNHIYENPNRLIKTIHTRLGLNMEELYFQIKNKLKI